MPLDFAGKGKQVSVGELIARKNYPKAIEVLKAALQKRRHDDRLRVQLADVMVLAGKPREAVTILNDLADDLALSGNAAKAIAALKKVQAIEPGRADVEEKLSYMITQQARPAEDPWARARRRIDRAKPADIGMEGVEAGGGSGEGRPPDVSFGMEEIAEEPGPAPPGAAAAAPSPPEGPPEAIAIDAGFQDELAALIEDVFTPTAALTAPDRPGPVMETPLFRDFSREELVAVIKGLRLVSFQAGEILCTEGEPGDSLFILTTGRVRAYVRSQSGRHMQVRELNEGDFFGEISILTGRPRTATVTCSTACELLEMGRKTFDEIALAHPRVWKVLKEFYDKRANSSLEAQIRAQ